MTFPSVATGSLPLASAPGHQLHHHHHLHLRPSLEKLPNELLLPIAEGLVPGAPLTTRFALRPSGTWEFRDAGHQWADFLAGHRNLLALAQASQRMADITKPLLYHTLVVPTPDVLVTLICRMKVRPEIAVWIRSITCLANLTSPVAVDATLCGLPTQNRGTLNPPVSTTIISDLLNFVVRNTPNLKDLFLASPDDDFTNNGTGGADGATRLCFRDAIIRYRTGAIDSFSGWLLNYSPAGLTPSLTTLRIYCNREDGDRELTLARFFADHAVQQLPRLKSLRTLELCCASAAPLVPAHEVIPTLPHLEHLRLYGSHIREPRLVALCLACVNLRSLVVHFEASSTDEDRDLLPDGKTLDDALGSLAGSLETLELVALSEGHYLTRGRERPRKPENHRLRCIPQLRRLRSLTLDYRGVFGTLGILEEDDGERLCQLLPPSVRDFTLVCEWGTARDWKQSYLVNLDMVLHGVECLCASKTHRLSSISLAIHSWPAESRFHKRFKREVEAARQRCARAGIKFRTFDLLPSYQDEDDPEPVDEEGFDDGGEGGPEAEGELEDNLGEGERAVDDELELEEEDEASAYYFSGDEASDPEREARRPPTFNDFLERLGEDHGHSLDELFYAYHEDRWDEYLF
ncbi:hypothetical protein VTK26DRAFT_1252 [Humicola hyalothermophila]